MRQPTTENLIARGPRQKGEREPNSIIESRIDAFTQANQKIALGHERRTCLRCAKDWGTATLCPQCGFNECEVREIRPTAVELKGWGLDARATIGAVAEKVKTKV